MRNRAVSIVTFNCEWRKTKSADAAAIRQRVLSCGPDVVCLTEAYADFFEGIGHTIEASPHRQDHPFQARRKVLLWSKNPWRQVSTQPSSELPQGRFVSGKTDTPAGEVTFFGVCIPYSFAGVRYEADKKQPWEVHLRYLAALEEMIMAAPRGLVVLGDFNQRVPRRYQPRAAFDALQKAILSRMLLATSGVIEPIGRQSIDHVCHSHDFTPRELISLSNLGENGRKISDHFGVHVSLRQDRKGPPEV